MKVTNDLLIWLFIILLLAFIFGLYSAENHRIPDTLYQRTKGSAVPYLEHYSERSSGFDVSGGASGRYGWGTSDSDYQRRVIRDDDDYQMAQEIKAKESEHQDISSNAGGSKCKKQENKADPQCVRDDNFKIRSDLCQKCDILDNPDIDKYVLKSSVPPCPNLSDYIKKSEIPSCKNADIDLNDYIKKSEIPAIPKCPECPKADCPKPTQTEKSTKNFNYNVVNTQDIEMLLRDKRIREYLDANYEKKNNIPKPTNDVSSSRQSPAKQLPSVEADDMTQSLFDFNLPGLTESSKRLQGNANMGSSSNRSSSSPSYNNPTTTLWGEIKSFFGFGPKTTSQSSSTSSVQGVSSEESHSQAHRIVPVNATFPGVKEEETKMVYNKSGLSAVDTQNCNTKPIEMQGMYAGDSLYSTV
jgi:hypothetical protein